MPLVKIEVEKGYSKEFLVQLQKEVMNCVVKSLKLPDDDRNIRLMEYNKGCFTMKSPYRIIIEISLFTGRSLETKKEIYRLIGTNLEPLGIKRDEIFIVLNEQPKENWGVRGCVPASEIVLDFKVEI